MKVVCEREHVSGNEVEHAIKRGRRPPKEARVVIAGTLASCNTRT